MHADPYRRLQVAGEPIEAMPDDGFAREMQREMEQIAHDVDRAAFAHFALGEPAARELPAWQRRWDVTLGAACVLSGFAGELVAIWRPVPWWPLLGLSLLLGIIGSVLLVKAIEA